MSQAAAELLILYKTEAKQWATYLQSVFTGLISEAGICLYDIAGVSGRREEFLRLAHYTCKLLILSRDLLEGLCQVQRFFLARVLSPASNVVVLLCGVDSMTPLLELVPLNGNECLQISSEQDVHEYLSTVTEIVRKGVSPTAANVKASTHKPPGSQQEVKISPLNGASSVRSSIVVVPSRVACRSAVEVFILLRNEALGDESDIEFTGKNLTVRVTPVRWNNQSLCINAPDFPAGNVDVTVYSNGVPLGKAQLQYYSSMQEIAHLLQSVAQPVEFMCQALQVSSLEKLDQKLASMLLQTMPTGGFQGLHCTNTPERELHRTDVPSLLHFAAQFDFKSVSSVLLQCPGAERALHTANRHGETAAEIAKSHGHAELHVLLKETLNMFNSSEDNGGASVYEMMCTAGNPSTTGAQKEQQGEEDKEEKQEEEEEEEDVYAPLGVKDEYDTILNSARAVDVANRPPAPTPRPLSTQVKEDKTPYITQVFKKKTTPQEDVYSFPTKRGSAQRRDDSVSAAYDTFVPKQVQKAGLPTVDEAARQQIYKRRDPTQKETLSQLRASDTNSREDNDSVYDKINIVHHTPSVTVKENRSRNQSDFYSKPLKGQHSSFFRKADKR
ncbi:B-cell scaffold protein with ankyrin repeats-like [Channa argus]|uniref:B-cell scaffold protein with ankyrin repeats-like n=1 Tax=Channa argus TaxID=215402 RepID=UPI002946777D|nr:hypothetical protein Q8A73_012834 [Channa argus]